MMNMSFIVDELSTSVGQGIFSSTRSAINHEEFNYGPENKKECPCDTCPMFDACLSAATECSAMRNWCSTGDFKDTDLQRLVRACG